MKRPPSPKAMVCPSCHSIVSGAIQGDHCPMHPSQLLQPVPRGYGGRNKARTYRRIKDKRLRGRWGKRS